MSDITGSILSFAGWAFLPRFISSFLQSVYYRITIRAGSPHPHPSSPCYARHYRRIYIFVVTSYLLYTFYDAYHRIRAQGDFYQILGVLPTADDRTIKSRFRRLAALHHPDKQGGFESTSTGDLFVHLKLAQDTLLDPTRRFVYDRFGREVIEGRKTYTITQLLYEGLYALLPQYFVGLVTLALLNTFWFSPWGRYWRFYTLFALFVLEVSLLTHRDGVFMPATYLPAWLSSLFSLNAFYLLPFQILSLARTASVTLNIFISQIAPPHASSSNQPSASLSPQAQQKLVQLAQLSRTCDMEATKLLQLQYTPFKGQKESVSRLRKGMKTSLIMGTVQESPGVQETIHNVTKPQGV
ncbi:membrane associated DnaJ chaperone [Coccidioides immitis RS]|uniref:Membrane associated DnaJ chaperone n=3 Tax=Coccidioides immitis TaxID=5501 RepID=A0A0D8JVD3_COCIM|nr:membrane associated DnaJ chaperone [Coccidioides immitis RS]KJF60896.1 membrane associated DnaJ chaperone [Coccidioides immitis RS]KMP06155.1 hypothetical protein CIRG_05836 [Coccidioides immitis RMSCC 2394]KMU87838.1 hypothetical protein CIHG_05605 [Coccidioides immitis H538.4]TPX22811.1 hypothetical protein DIZ76_014690 [Coccidioides immitis]